jgi:hypothetical protein
MTPLPLLLAVALPALAQQPAAAPAAADAPSLSFDDFDRVAEQRRADRLACAQGIIDDADAAARLQAGCPPGSPAERPSCAALRQFQNDVGNMRSFRFAGGRLQEGHEGPVFAALQRGRERGGADGPCGRIFSVQGDRGAPVYFESTLYCPAGRDCVSVITPESRGLDIGVPRPGEGENLATRLRSTLEDMLCVHVTEHLCVGVAERNGTRVRRVGGAVVLSNDHSGVSIINFRRPF